MGFPFNDCLYLAITRTRPKVDDVRESDVVTAPNNARYLGTYWIAAVYPKFRLTVITTTLSSLCAWNGVRIDQGKLKRVKKNLQMNYSTNVEVRKLGLWVAGGFEA